MGCKVATVIFVGTSLCRMKVGKPVVMSLGLTLGTGLALAGLTIVGSSVDGDTETAKGAVVAFISPVGMSLEFPLWPLGA